MPERSSKYSTQNIEELFHIYIYIYIERERQRQREKKKERQTETERVTDRDTGR